ncbi:uncharacterized protein BDR25DRAFT_354482 [Lindgomyces ingoldianus]|uniref:Uncharacterized protein n=1 Tax=Lindgomyces ingoldianus TaxID=673940 RepID=A0ACB6QWB5_9PLEO|nr:uncharacterized protein BDR25DRAFT_354482 [Lindgomyces ingoldianus]KAF2471226.1 hypothetical protein BDR25DRAFT_354482 [Lindgomyces ingoldianus]
MFVSTVHDLAYRFVVAPLHVACGLLLEGNSTDALNTGLLIFQGHLTAKSHDFIRNQRPILLAVTELSKLYYATCCGLELFLALSHMTVALFWQSIRFLIPLVLLLASHIPYGKLLKLLLPQGSERKIYQKHAGKVPQPLHELNAQIFLAV